MTDWDRLADKAYPNPYDCPEPPEVTDCEVCEMPFSDEEIRHGLHQHPFHLRVVCSWCSKPMGYKACDEEVDGQISHGICKPCGVKFNASMMDEG